MRFVDSEEWEMGDLTLDFPRMQKHAGLDAQSANKPGMGRMLPPTEN